MTLYIPNSLSIKVPAHLKSRRTQLNKLSYHYKRQLVRAYVSGNQVRIDKAKLSLARVLKELAESPELGPRMGFKLGYRLELIIKRGFDPRISWEQYEATNNNWYKVAVLLERSVDYD